MRKLKFRLFGKNSEEFLGVAPYGLSLNELQNVCDLDAWHIMQFTGLIDKNGVEIYEGDILSTDLSRPYLVVEFLGGSFMYQCHDSGDDYYDYMSPTCNIRTQDKYCSVVGNVHQHPELLEGTTNG